MNRDFADLSGFHEFTRRAVRNNKRLADGGLGGDTHLASPLSPPQAANQPRIVESTGGKEYATFVVAASNSTAHGKASADYVCDGVADDVEINAAIAALDPGIGGRVLLLEGTFNLAATVNLDCVFALLEGQGPSTILSAAAIAAPAVTFGAANYMALGRLYCFGGTRGVDMTASGFSPVVRDVYVSAVSNAGILCGGLQALVTGCHVLAVNTGTWGIQATSYCLIVGNTIRSGSAATGILVLGVTGASITDNHIYLLQRGIWVTANADYNSIQGNVIRYGNSAGGYGIDIDDPTCEANLVTNNDLYLSGSLGSLRDLGTGTVTAAGNRL